MPAVEIASTPLPAAPLSERIPLIGFLRRELAPFPGRGVATLRIVLGCTVVLVFCMAQRVPETYLAVWVVTRMAMEESSQSVLTGIVLLLALTIGLAIPLALLTVAMDQPALRFCLMAALAAMGLFLRRTFVIGVFGFVIGFIGVLVVTAPDFLLMPERAVRFTLWLWPVFALGIAAAVAGNLLIAPTDPAGLLRDELTIRLRAAENALNRRLGRWRDESGAARLATAGVARLLKLLKSAEVVHPPLRARHGQQAALITLVDRLVSSAAALELLPPALPRVDERERLERVAEGCARLRRVLSGEPMPEHAPLSPPAQVSAGTATLPVLVELEHVVNLMQQAVASEDLPAELAATGSAEGGLFVPDAFTNPEYVRYALKGTLAVMICYAVQNAVNWPGIRTCLVTCLIVGLGTEGATAQKGTLRMAGAAVGAAMGFLAILLLIPSMESITSLALLVAAGTAIAAWVTVGSPRISYAGVQIALAFFICVIQGFAPTWYFYTIRDRLVGILLGNVVITLVFQYVWPVRAADEMWKGLAAAVRAMARLATVGSSSDDQTEVVARANSLRAQAVEDFTSAQQWADDAAFELTGAAPERLAARERLQRAAADAQSVLLTQLAITHQRPAVATMEVPRGVISAARRFDAVVGEYLEVVADRALGVAHRDLPELGRPFHATTELMQAERRLVADPEVAAQIDGRLALYRELVPRIERLGSANVGE
jgi:multidrug resistance protein MdtO